MAVSKILKEKTAEEIQHPAPRPFEVAGKIYPILPMPDGILISVAKEIGNVSSLLKSISNQKAASMRQSLAERRAAGEEIDAAEEAEALSLRLSNFTYSDMAELLPEIVQVLLPSASKIIAASLRQSEDWVQDTLYYRDRLRALKLILEAEDIPLLLGEWKALAGIFQSTTP